MRLNVYLHPLASDAIVAQQHVQCFHVPCSVKADAKQLPVWTQTSLLTSRVNVLAGSTFMKEINFGRIGTYERWLLTVNAARSRTTSETSCNRSSTLKKRTAIHLPRPGVLPTDHPMREAASSAAPLVEAVPTGCS
jgi:hypothetical protein